MNARILVVDDDREIVKILRGYLENAGYTVLYAYDGQTAVHILRHDKPDLALLDIMLPNKDGWELTRFIRNDTHLSTLPVILITARVDQTDRVVGLELGADDYITKPFFPREVVARVRALLRRVNFDPVPTTTLITIDHLQLNTATHQITVAQQTHDLTPTEFKLLHLFMEQPNRIFTRESLLEQALGYAYEGMGRTLDTHIRNLRQKIEPDPKNPTYIQTVYRVGYRFVGGK